MATTMGIRTLEAGTDRRTVVGTMDRRTAMSMAIITWEAQTATKMGTIT